MAVESERVTADVIEVSEFPDVAHRFGVRGVPMTSINDRVTVVGALPEGRLLAKVLEATSHA